MNKVIFDIKNDGKNITLGDEVQTDSTGLVITKEHDVFLNLDETAAASEEDKQLLDILNKLGWLE